MTTTWQGCYDDSWRGDITDESFAHPAKAARGLVARIFDYLNLPRGSVVVDPFGGVGTTGIIGAGRGLRCFASELESKFHQLALANYELHRRTWEQFNDPMPVIVCGDSRKLRENLAGVMADCVVSSPPYATGTEKLGAIDWTKTHHGSEKAAYGSGSCSYKNGAPDGYGTTPGQLGAMPSGTVDAVVSSPPYNKPFSQDHPGTNGGTRGTNGEPGAFVRYGNTPGQLEGMTMGCVHDFTDAMWCDRGNHWCPRAKWTTQKTCGVCMKSHAGDAPLLQRTIAQVCSVCGIPKGETTGDTFWAAASDIVAECWHILKPGGLAVWVCKDFVRKGARVPFSDDWRRLCESHGFELVEWIHASLVKEDRHPGLFGEEIVKRTERKSFFRRLAEKKGSPAIDHEDVLVLRKVATGAKSDGVADAVVGSPPFCESLSGNGECPKLRPDGTPFGQGKSIDLATYGTTPGQLGAMRPGKVEDATG